MKLNLPVSYKLLDSKTVKSPDEPIVLVETARDFVTYHTLHVGGGEFNCFWGHYYPKSWPESQQDALNDFLDR